ncbi:MAG TPA: PAS domain-containing protein, partial [Stellaceae bacterium]|nr:PAS domain-containing protein [Stellaceae bacterium]
MAEDALILPHAPGRAEPGAADFGVWTGHRIPDDRSSWHPLVRQFYEYWRAVSPPGRLPARRHIQPEEIVPLLSRLWMLDVFRDPLRLRYRLVGTDITRSVQRELTGTWLDESQPSAWCNPQLQDRYRFMLDTKQATWRRGPVIWERDPTHRFVENCLAPLATDGETVDKIIAVSVI